MKSYVISVSLRTGCYRHIRIGETETLDRLHKVILNAFDFVDDHEHAFFLDNRVWSPADAYFSSKTGPGERLTKRYTLKKLQLEKGQKFKYVFDFGDEWTFQCKVLQELEEKTDIPGVIRSVGEAPAQYPDWEDAEDDEEDFEDSDEEERGILTPEEREELYNCLPMAKETVDEIRNYLNAAASLYGLLPVEELLEIYNSQNPPIEEQLFMMALVAIHMDVQVSDCFDIVDIPGAKFDEKHMARCCQVASMELMYDDPEQNIRELSRQQKGKPLKRLPKEAFLKYADETYFPDTPQKNAMLQYMRGATNLTQEDVQDWCTEVQQSIVADDSLESILQHYDMAQITKGKKWDIVEFIRLFQDLNNNTHKHANRGYTPVEMYDIFAKEKNKPIDGQGSLF